MSGTKKKTSKKKLIKEKKTKVKKRIFLFFILIVLAISLIIATYFLIKSTNRNVFYQDYLFFLEKTKTALYPDMNHKDEKENISSWIVQAERIQKKYKDRLINLKPLIKEAIQNSEKNDIQSVKKQIQASRIIFLTVIKQNGFYTNTIIMEDLLTIILDMEKSIEKKDDMTLIDQYRDFITKYQSIGSSLIPSDILKIGESMDLLYKEALYQNMSDAKTTFNKIKQLFIQSYQDFK